MLKLRGLACPFSLPMLRHVDGWRVQFEEGCFSASLRGEIPLWVNHRKAAALAPAVACSETARGLFFAATVRDPTWEAFLHAAAQHGEITGCSVAWALASQVGQRLHATGIHVISRARLLEISVMVQQAPAFSETWLTVKGE